jgi:dihydrolipoamide dehydrogenase
MAYDVIVIGSGPGGYPAAIRASQLGKKALVVSASTGAVFLQKPCLKVRRYLNMPSMQKIMAFLSPTLRPILEVLLAAAVA